MTDLTTIFCEIDDFCKKFEAQMSLNKNLLSNSKGKRVANTSLTLSEVMCISIWYHFSGYTTFKDYYIKYVVPHLKYEFPKLVSYTRFIELKQMVVLPLFIFLVTKKLSSCTGISFIDSFKLDACHIKRSSSHKTLRNIAKRGRTSMGWFYGMKVHIIVNHKGEIVSFYISSGNVADNNTHVLINITNKIIGKLFGDKGYLVNANLFRKLYEKGIEIITKIRSNMKNRFMTVTDKLLLRKRGFIESAGDILKKHLYMEHTRHRSLWGFFLNILTSLTAYQFRDKKPKISCQLAEKLLIA